MEEDEQPERVQLALVLRRPEVLERHRIQPAELRREQRRLPEEVEDGPRVVGLRVVADVVAEPRVQPVVAEQADRGQHHPQLAGAGHAHHPVQRVGVRHAEEPVLAAADGIGGQDGLAAFELDHSRGGVVQGNRERPERPHDLPRRLRPRR